MQNDLRDLTGSNPLTGLRSKVKPLTAAEWSRYEQWMQTLPIERLKSMQDMLRELPETIAAKIAERAADEAAGYWIHTFAGRRLIASMTGTSMIWAMMRKKVDSSIDLVTARSEVTFENHAEILEIVLELNGFERAAEGNPEAPE